MRVSADVSGTDESDRFFLVGEFTYNNSYSKSQFFGDFVGPEYTRSNEWLVRLLENFSIY